MMDTKGQWYSIIFKINFNKILCFYCYLGVLTFLHQCHTSQIYPATDRISIAGYLLGFHCLLNPKSVKSKTHYVGVC